MTFEHLWAGWRHEYVQAATDVERSAGGDDGAGDACVFCTIADSGTPDEQNLVVWRGEHTYVVLNLYPYTSGHLLVVPSRHLAGLDELDPAESAELWAATRRSADALGSAYEPDALNVGANVGRAAGAGIPRHLHLHVVPRWSGDTNFMTAIAGTRVLSESLPETWRRLHAAFCAEDAATSGPGAAAG